MQDASGTSKVYWKEVHEAATKTLGEKMCFNCQTYKKVDQGSHIWKGKIKQWRCFRCQSKKLF